MQSVKRMVDKLRNFDPSILSEPSVSTLIDGMSFLHHFAEAARYEKNCYWYNSVVEAIIKHPGLMNKDCLGNTSLHYLAKTGDLRCVFVNGFFTDENEIFLTPYDYWISFGNNKEITCADVIDLHNEI